MGIRLCIQFFQEYLCSAFCEPFDTIRSTCPYIDYRMALLLYVSGNRIRNILVLHWDLPYIRAIHRFSMGFKSEISAGRS